MKFRSIIFWLHLIAGIFAGIVILIMSVTGVLLAFERQIIESAERDFRSTQPQWETTRLPMETLLAKVRETETNNFPTSISLQSEPDAPVIFAFGRERALLVDAYSGKILGEGAEKTRGFFRTVTNVHRWLATSEKNRTIGKGITGACNLAFLFLVVSGFYLWWPRKWNWASIKAVFLFNRQLSGKARDFNWHNVIGSWSAIPLFFVVLTGVIMSYTWANNLLFRATGNEPPLPRAAPTRTEKPREEKAADLKFEKLNQLWANAEQKFSDWKTITLRLPSSVEGPLIFSVERGTRGRPDLKTQLTFNPKTGELTEETFASFNLGKKLRTWSRWVHTGEAGGFVGQLIAGLVSAGGALLVWTGLALACRRFLGRKTNRVEQNKVSADEPLSVEPRERTRD
jgi:uncharacterized iron-regulated membrane protein